MCELTRTEKERIRKRDGARIKLTGKCSLCGKEGSRTTRHHLWYCPEKCTREAVIEVCDECDGKIHKRDENDQRVRDIRSLRTIRILNNDDNGEYVVTVKDEVVGRGFKTDEGIRLIFDN